MNKKFQSQPAYSLIFAFIVITVMLLVAAATIENTNDKISYYKDLEGGSLAYLAAQSAAELGILDMKHFNPGYEMIGGAAFEEDADGDGTAETHGDYTIYSKAKENDNDGTAGTYYLPMPGTGSAGNPDDCSILNDDEPVDHSCNWNKLLYGQTVTIPLYSDDGLGGIDLPTDLGLTGLNVKMRTPCVNGSLSDSCDGDLRYVMDEDQDIDTDLSQGGDTVVFWQLTGEDSVLGSVSLLPNDEDYRTPKKRDPSYNTEIYEKQINDQASAASDTYVVSEFTLSGNNLCIKTSCLDLSNVTDLSLILYVAAPLLDDAREPIPYLEWQVEDVGGNPIADTKAVVMGEGYHQGSKHIFYYPYLLTRYTTGEATSVYSLSN